MNNFNIPGQIDLQLALLMIGVILIIAVILFNIVRLKKAQKSSKRSAQSMSEGGLEPGLSSQSKDKDVTYNGAQKSSDLNNSRSERLEPSISQNSTFESVGAGSAASAESYDLAQISRINSNIDCVVFLKFSLPISGTEILDHARRWPKIEMYRIALEGLSTSMVASQATLLEQDSQLSSPSVWDHIEANQSYSEIQAGIQLANRRGPIQAEQLSELLGFVQHFSQELDAEIDMPPIADILNEATDLDQFAIQCDIQLGFHIATNMLSWSCLDVQNMLLKQGFVMSREGSSFNYFHADVLLFKAQVPTLNFLRDDLQTLRVNQIFFSLDVPLVPESMNPFVKMLQVGQDLAAELDGKLLDDNGQVLSSLSIQGIENQIAPIYQLMRERNIEPGSPSACRLFS